MKININSIKQSILIVLVLISMCYVVFVNNIAVSISEEAHLNRLILFVHTFAKWKSKMHASASKSSNIIVNAFAYQISMRIHSLADLYELIHLL